MIHFYQNYMKNMKTKIKRSISVDKNINDIMNEKITNKSKYIEWLIYQDIKEHMSDDERIKKIII